MWVFSKLNLEEEPDYIHIPQQGPELHNLVTHKQKNSDGRTDGLAMAIYICRLISVPKNYL